MTSIVWFRQDLRLADNPALTTAVKNGPVLPVYVLEDPEKSGDPHPIGGASRWWLHHALDALQKSLGGLLLLKGDARIAIPELAQRLNAQGVYWNRCYEPHAIARDSAIKSELKDIGIKVESFGANLLTEPFAMQTKSGGQFKVFTPFWRALQQTEIHSPLTVPQNIALADIRNGLSLDELSLLPKKPDWAKGWNDLWTPGEDNAFSRFTAFLDTGLKGYGELRNRPDKPNVSRLSPHLHFGEISPRQIWHHVKDNVPSPLSGEADKFLSELAWRDFSYHLLYHFPDLPEKNWKPNFDAYPWVGDDDKLTAWQQGQTGYPIVDAGMRELWQTGYMHNRVRMITASFLIKHLRLDWRHGEKWFWDTLLDADLASNSASWQWVAGSGADASPYFRIFNPMTQGEKFDPEGQYVRRYVPELKKLPNAHLHAPFDAPEEVLENAGVKLGTTYPHPVVDHMKARQAALEGYEAVKAANLQD